MKKGNSTADYRTISKSSLLRKLDLTWTKRFCFIFYFLSAVYLDRYNPCIRSPKKLIMLGRFSLFIITASIYISSFHDSYAQINDTSSVIEQQKYFIAKMRTNYDNQDDLVKLFDPYMNETDKALSHPNEDNLEYTMQLPGEHGVQYFSLAEIRLNAPTLKEQGVDIISYDLETEYSSDHELRDPILSVRAASEIVHENNMSFMISPSMDLSDQFGTQLAVFADMYNIQAQSLQMKPNQFAEFVEETAMELRSANPGISISAQVSTARGSIEGMKESVSLIVDTVDGITTWYTNDPEGLNKLSGFIEWFNNKFR